MVDGVAFEAFSFRYVVTSGSGKNRHEQTYWFTVLAVPMPLAAPDLTLEPEGLAMKLFDALGGEDIDFESDAFSRRFWVKCRDRKFAYDVITPAMMERLLATPQGWSWQWRGGSLVVSRVGPMRPEDAPGIVALASVFTQDLPRHLLAARPARP
jgi:hypothetical protein